MDSIKYTINGKQVITKKQDGINNLFALLTQGRQWYPSAYVPVSLFISNILNYHTVTQKIVKVSECIEVFCVTVLVISTNRICGFGATSSFGELCVCFGDSFLLLLLQFVFEIFFGSHTRRSLQSIQQNP